MTVSPLKQAIPGRCRGVLAARERKQVCAICWPPDEWPPADVWLALQEMRRDGIIACTRRSSLTEDGFVLNGR
ncbi:hypothetical protein CBW22_12085 [Pantoea sp. VS1]|uniref:hypothetical protein n=1 Tax=Pantoea sp. VS1 TaxID=2003658 RepID=UPI000B508869|nr:hypothetical protein [Pantoea sp. VS1]OWS75372.1 hypothetical protein CBW22_12085 [Pantoea sp. VS1]